MAKLRSCIVGATGLAGQQLIAALSSHPTLEVAGLAASPRSAGKTYEEALKSPSGMMGWLLPEPLPKAVGGMKVQNGAEVSGKDYDLVFSAVEADVARELEPKLAKDVPVFSTASAFRYEEDVPLLIPPVNASHAQLVVEQRHAAFERNRHAHLVGQQQKVVGKLRRNVDRQHPVEVVVALCVRKSGRKRVPASPV